MATYHLEIDENYEGWSSHIIMYAQWGIPDWFATVWTHIKAIPLVMIMIN